MRDQNRMGAVILTYVNAKDHTVVTFVYFAVWLFISITRNCVKFIPET